ncbi:M14 family zinc carboxypeptidase [Salinimicrobium sp. HB62]|uniref:M14 family zinc carboxypeptidase n=1 Tax=Salinimicrobium sp. HB62 TaxID=3077781 RepID=UPI002D766EE1|nr:M14 family zinc carboxypeptidase [Salinimicrobium sp. HB62]
MESVEEFLQTYNKIKATEIHGRYLEYSALEEALQGIEDHFQIKEAGSSFLNIPIKTIKVGKGSKKILAWSQMHGNETTTTKGVLDLLHLFIKHKADDTVKEILQQCTVLIMPMLNPDGAARYTRENVNKVDLNRDACDLKEPESKVLRKVFEEFKPDFCFNLHDQRTLFGAGDTNLPATLSFLAPSMDEARTITPVRIQAMKIISAMNAALQEVIPGQVGRFDDSFNINCTGDFFQAREVPTILFECGHFQQDYLREETRRYFTLSIFTAFRSIASGKFQQEDEQEYFSIPQNKKNFRDVILRNAVLEGSTVDIALQYLEKMKAGEVHFLPQVGEIGANLSLFGHYEIDCKEQEVTKEDGTSLIENDIVEGILLNKEKLLIKPPYLP